MTSRSIYARCLLRVAVALAAVFGGDGIARAEEHAESGAEPGLVINVDATAPRTQISSNLFGIFFEEINHSGEGGLYAELVLNRDFEINTLPAGASWAGNLLRTRNGWQERKWFGNELWGWKLEAEGEAKGSFRQDTVQPLNPNNPHSMRVTARVAGRRLAVVNSGFWGMNFQAGKRYDLSFYARTEGAEHFNVTASLESASGHEIHSETVLTNVGGPWRKYQCILTPQANDSNGRLALGINGMGTLWLDVVSLFPQETFKRRPNGLRADLAQLLADLKPAFVRFPGGAVVGGLNLDNRFQWKNSIGDIAQRKGSMNLWGYFSSYGLGLHEYLQLCEDIGADALYVCNPGFSDNYRRAEIAPPDKVQSFVQEALDALEYALGPADSKWGAQRAANGHPLPFRLKYIEIGNETAGNVYVDNYRRFYDAIKAKYPQVTIICSERLKEGAPVEIVDDHKYGSPTAFFEGHSDYDQAARTGPKVYVGEYGCNTTVGQGNLLAALAEATYLLGLERNSDLVRMASYAPLFFHVNDVAWPVNLIGFDSSRVAPRSSYFVQQMLALNRPDEALKTTLRPDAPGAKAEVYALAGLRHKSGELILSVVNRAGTARTAVLRFDGLSGVARQASVTTLGGVEPTAENTVDDPTAVRPVESIFRSSDSELRYSFEPYSLTVMRFRVE